MSEGIELTPSQQMFCEEYITTLNATQAYAKVYPEVSYISARTLAYKLLANVGVSARVKELIEERSKATQITSEFVLRNLVEVANRSLNAVPVMIFDPVNKEMVQKGADIGEPVWEYDSHGANKALELIGRHVGMFEKDNKQKQPDQMTEDKFLIMLEAARQGSK